MKTPLITIPLKKTDETDWVRPLQSYLTRVYGSFEEYRDETAVFNKLRSDMSGAGKDITGRDLLYRYYGQLELLDLRIPVDQHGGVNVTFTWYDAFKPTLSTSQHSLAFEKVGVLFNLAAVLSSLGASYHDDDDLKDAYQALQWGAGVLQFISENFLHAPSDDLHQDTIKALTKLMLAQAQEVFVVRLIEDSAQSTKPSLLARLAKSCSVFYQLAREALGEVSSKGVDSKWENVARVKHKYYSSVANYYQAMNLKGSGKYGAAISHAKQAREDFKEIKLVNIGTENFTKFSEISKKWTETLKAEIAELEKDNDYIYHDIVPATVAEIKPMDSATAVPMHKQSGSMVKQDLFEKIVPMAVHEQESFYSEEKAKLLRDESNKITVADEELSSVLEFLRLPKSLVDIKELLQMNASSIDLDDDSDEVDARVLAVASEISTSRSNDARAVVNVRSQIYQILQNCETVLDNEEKTYTSNKSQYGGSWAQQPPDNFSLREELMKIKKSLADSAVSDQTLSQLIEGYKAEIDVLKAGPNSAQLKKAFAVQKQPDVAPVSLVDLDDTGIAATKSKIDQVDGKVQELRYLQKERQNTYNDMKELVHKDDISKILVLNKQISNMEEVFEQELAKFKPYQERIETTISKQEPLISKIKAFMSDILDDDTVKRNRKLKKAQTSTKKAVTGKYLQAYEQWKQYGSGVEQALKFYSQLLGYANDVRAKVETYARTRSDQATRLSGSMSSQDRDQYALRDQLSRLSIGSSGISPQGTRAPSYSYPPVPAKPTVASTNQYQPPPPPKPLGYGMMPMQTTPQTQQNSTNATSESFYNTPSVYDPALYTKFSQG